MKTYKGLNIPIEYDESIINQKTACYNAWDLQECSNCSNCLFNYFNHEEDFNEWKKIHKREKKLERICKVY